MIGRRRLPNRRPNLTVRIEDAATGGWWDLAVGYGYAADGTWRVREIWLDKCKRGGDPLDILVHHVCKVLSRDCLQRDVGFDELGRGLAGEPPSLLTRVVAAAAELERAPPAIAQPGGGE